MRGTSKPKLSLVIALTSFLLGGCETLVPKSHQVDVHITSLLGSKNGKATHGCLIRTERGKDFFEQTVRFESGENKSDQFAVASISYDAEIDQLTLLMICQASQPYMFESTTRELNAYDKIVLSTTFKAKLPAEKQLETVESIVKQGFSISLNADSNGEQTMQSDNNVTLALTEVDLWNIATAYHEILGIKPAAEYPICRGKLDFAFDTLTFTAHPQQSNSKENYLYLDSSTVKPTENEIYIRKWELSGLMTTATC